MKRKKSFPLSLRSYYDENWQCRHYEWCAVFILHKLSSLPLSRYPHAIFFIDLFRSNVKPLVYLFLCSFSCTDGVFETWVRVEAIYFKSLPRTIVDLVFLCGGRLCFFPSPTFVILFWFSPPPEEVGFFPLFPLTASTCHYGSVNSLQPDRIV